MVGFPKHLNSKNDYLYVIENFPRPQWEPHLRALLDNRFGWFCTGPADGEGATDATHRVEVMEDGGKLQYEYRENPQATIYRIGFTVEEVEALL